MTARLTAAEARQLGLLDTKQKRTTKRKLPRTAATVCQTCDERFTTDAAENRHVDETLHARYEMELP